MTNIETLTAIQQELQALEQISFVAHRDTTEAMPVIGREIALPTYIAMRIDAMTTAMNPRVR